MASFDADRASDPVGIREESSILRCKKCRRSVVDSACLLSVSDEPMAGCRVWHVDVDALPDWILSVIKQVHWTAGKLNCQHCGARLGGFNFLNCSQCPCGHNTAVHFTKSCVDEVVNHLIYLNRPGTSRVHTGFQVEPKSPEVPEDRILGTDSPQVTNQLNSEPEVQSRQIQATHFDGEMSVISPLSSTLSLPLTCPAQGEVNEPATRDADEHTRLTPTELSDHLQNPGSPLDSFTASMHDTVMEQVDISNGATEEPQNSAGPMQVLIKRQRNRLKSLRRKQRKKKLWNQKQLEEKQRVSSIQYTSDEEEKEYYMCAVCLDVYYKPHICQPCSHVFCEPCLRTLAKSRTSSTPCPLCRTLISHVIFQEELHQHTRSQFPKVYQRRNETFQKTNYSKWPLPGCPKHIHVLRGLRRCRALAGQWRFPLRTLRLNRLELGWTNHSITFILYFYWVLFSFFSLCGFLYILLW